MAAVVARPLSASRLALPAALAVSLAVHAGMLGWWTPFARWAPTPAIAPPLPELHATLVEPEAAGAPAASHDPIRAERAAEMAPRAPPARPPLPRSRAVQDATPTITAPSRAMDLRPAPVAEPAPAPVPAPVSPPSMTAPSESPGPVAVVAPKALAAGPGAATGTEATHTTTPIAYRDNPPPAYPEAARRDGQQGLTVLEVLVSRQGMPMDVTIVATSGFSALDAAAAASVRQWRFVPATREREPIDARIRVPVRFRLTADGR